MSKIISILFIAVYSLAALAQTIDKTSAGNPLDAKKDALLAYLKSVAESDKYISGQRWDKKNWEEIKKQTGKLPAIMCVEYCIAEGNRKLRADETPIKWDRLNEIIAKHWQEGGLVRITCHFPNPYNENYGGLRTKLGDDGAKLLSKEDSPEKKRWKDMVSEVANGVKDLNKRGVIPIFGPMHEMNGKWFWWGADLSAKTQRALWNQIFTALKRKGCRAVWLNALTPSLPIDEIKGPDFRKMDVVGCDVYGLKSANNLSIVREKYAMAAKTGKLFTLSEFGAYSASNPTADKGFGTYDLCELIRQMDTHCARAYGVVFWGGPWGIHMSKNADKFMRSPKIITLGGIAYEGR